MVSAASAVYRGLDGGHEPVRQGNVAHLTQVLGRIDYGPSLD